MRILGISAFYHDSAAAIIENGSIIGAAQEERFTRVKHDKRFPENAIAYCLKAAETDLASVDHVVFFEKPFVKFERLIETYLDLAPRGFQSFRRAMPLWIKEKLFQKSELVSVLKSFDPNFPPEKLLFGEHHQSHAASAFFPSPFEEAVVLTADGVGEWATTSIGVGRGADLKIHKEIHFPHSLGLLYSAFTYYTGFKVNSGEYKVMGLAPYGQPRFRDKIMEHLIDVKPDGSFSMDMRYFNYAGGLTMTSPLFDDLFGGPPRNPETDRLTDHHMDLAASVQVVCEEVMLGLARHAVEETGIRNLCLAGGVALNCVANGKILRDGQFDNIWVQPAAGDAGGALGAALAAHHGLLEQPRTVRSSVAEPSGKPGNGQDSMAGAYLGPSYKDSEIAAELTDAKAVFKTVSNEDMLDTVAEALANQKVVGWFQGRMEYGPRALGGRSIIADPRSPEMQSLLNLKIKYRESFRPFAPAVLAEHLSDWFEHDGDSPYMLMVANIREKLRIAMTEEEEALFGIEKLNVPRSSIPAVTHVDYSARLQSVHEETNPAFHGLLTRFHAATGCPVLVNTSFNVRGEPIVCTPLDAFRCFMGTEMDLLAIGNQLLWKQDQDPALALDYKNSFELD